MTSERRYRAVLLDFRGILVHSPDADWWISEAVRRLGRSMNDIERARATDALARIPNLPGYEEDELRVDTSLEANREVMMRRFLGVGIDSELAESLYQLDFDVSAWPVYPDAPEVVQAIRDRGYATALVSDFHVDLRPFLSASGIELDAFVISFEHGYQKPDPRMFTTALELLDVGPRDALMVGDRPSHDGGAALVGIDTMILPAPTTFGPRGLDVILKLVS
jgi:putative hydrolase of the HAD superfamily